MAQVEAELRAVNMRFGALHGAAGGRELDLFGRCLPAATPPGEPEPPPAPRALAVAGASRLRLKPAQGKAPDSPRPTSMPDMPGGAHSLAPPPAMHRARSEQVLTAHFAEEAAAGGNGGAPEREEGPAGAGVKRMPRPHSSGALADLARPADSRSPFTLDPPAQGLGPGGGFTQGLPQELARAPKPAALHAEGPPRAPDAGHLVSRGMSKRGVQGTQLMRTAAESDSALLLGGDLGVVVVQARSCSPDNHSSQFAYSLPPSAFQ